MADIAAIISMPFIIEVGCYLFRGIPTSAIVIVTAKLRCCYMHSSSNYLGFLAIAVRLMELIQLLSAYEVICLP